MLEEYFSRWGKVLSFQIIRDQTHRSKGYGFVTFELAESATSCLNHSHHMFEGRTISVKNCKEKERHGRYQNNMFNSPNYHHNQYRSPMHQYQNHVQGYYRPPMPQGGAMGWGGRQIMHTSPDQHQADSMSTKSNNSHRNGTPRTTTPNKFDDELSIYVGGVPHVSSEHDLTAHFSRFGIVEHVSVAKNKEAHEPHKGFAFVTFQSKEDRDKCLESGDHRINSRILRVEKKKSTNKSRDRLNTSIGRIKSGLDSSRMSGGPVSPEIQKYPYGHSIPITNHIQQYFPHHYQNQQVYPQYMYHHGPVYQPYLHGNNDPNMLVNQPLILPQQLMHQPQIMVQQHQYQAHGQQHPSQMGYNMYQHQVAAPIQEKDTQAVNTA